jgi:MFS family permease
METPMEQDESAPRANEDKLDPKKRALGFLVLLGIISLFADLTHEGARSLYGPYLAMLGASAATVGFVSGLGEFIGYSLRLLTGWLSDRSRRYWLMTILGYCVNLVAIPLLAFAGEFGWVYACALIVVERFGKAIRSPAKTTLASFAAQEVGAGKGFALQELMDQIGAFLGPVMLSLVLLAKGGSENVGAYSLAFATLAVPAVLALAFVLIARARYPRPHELETKSPVGASAELKLPYWLYFAGIALVAAGFADFPLIAFHFKKVGLFEDAMVPLVYAFAMAVDAGAAIVFGTLFDRKGMGAVMVAAGVSAVFAPLAFLSADPWIALAGIAVWGVGMGAQESILKAAITTMVAKEKRGTAFGFFNAGFGAFWFLGSWLMGALYEVSLPALVAFSVAAQLAAIPLFALSRAKAAAKTAA